MMLTPLVLSSGFLENIMVSLFGVFCGPNPSIESHKARMIEDCSVEILELAALS